MGSFTEPPGICHNFHNFFLPQMLIALAGSYN